MAARKAFSFLLDLEVSREGMGSWSIRGCFSDGSSFRLASVGEGASDPRGDAALAATAEAVASTLRLLHRRLEIEELGIGGRTARASVDYDAASPSPYRAVVLAHGRRSERFEGGDPARDWSAMRARSREVAEILVHGPSCRGFADDVPGWRLDPALGMIAARPEAD